MAKTCKEDNTKQCQASERETSLENSSLGYLFFFFNDYQEWQRKLTLLKPGKNSWFLLPRHVLLNTLTDFSSGAESSSSILGMPRREGCAKGSLLCA